MSLGEARIHEPRRPGPHAGRGAAPTRGRVRLALLACLGIAGLIAVSALLAACATGPSRRPTFVGRQEGTRQPPDLAEGLNPMASVDTCTEGNHAAGKGVRVLVSPPAHFSKQATEMIVSLRRSLVGSPQGELIQMWLAPQPLRTAEDARREGLRCAAVIVLWEALDTNSLELTLPQPTEVPLRHMVRERLCEFGSDRQQVAILFFTISGLAAMLDNRYDEAVYYMEAANRIDVSCFQLPSLPAHPAESAEGGSLPRQAPEPGPR